METKHTPIYTAEHGEASELDKFYAVRKLLSVLWHRRLKHSSGAVGVLGYGPYNYVY